MHQASVHWFCWQSKTTIYLCKKASVHKATMILLTKANHDISMHEASVQNTFMNLMTKQHRNICVHQGFGALIYHDFVATAKSLYIYAPSLGAYNCQSNIATCLCTKTGCIQLSWFCCQSKVLIDLCTKPCCIQILWYVYAPSLVDCFCCQATSQYIFLCTQAWALNTIRALSPQQIIIDLCTKPQSIVECQGLVHKYSMIFVCGSKIIIALCNDAFVHECISILLWMQSHDKCMHQYLVHKSIFFWFDSKTNILVFMHPRFGASIFNDCVLASAKLVVVCTAAWCINLALFCCGHKLMKVVCTDAWCINVLANKIMIVLCTVVWCITISQFVLGNKSW